MRIAINTRLLIQGKLDGIGWFTAETTRRIVLQHPEHEFYFFFDRTPAKEFIYAQNVHPIILQPPARHPILWYIFFEISVKRALKKYKIDLFLSPDGWISLHTKVPTLTVIHDINFEHTKGNLKPSHQIYMSHYFPKFAHTATRIATVSQFSKNDIINTYNISPNKIDVVYDGAHEEYQPFNKIEKNKIRQQYTNGYPYFIFISTIIKRKNLTNLLLAFDKFKKHDIKNTKLVVVGARVWWKDELKKAYNNMQHQKDVIFIGWAEAPTVAKLLSAAIALVYPSYFEGFGIPILEAFNAETPVIASNITSMPEVAGDAAILIDPHNINQIENAISSLSDNEDLRLQYIEKGRIQRKKFSWDLTTEKLWNSLMRTYNESCENIG